jgi:hypothetical protein
VLRSTPSPAGARPPCGAARVAARARLAVPILLAATLLMGPIVLWAIFGDGNPQTSIQVALVAAVMAWAVARRAEDRDGAAAPPAPYAPVAPVAHPATCESAHRRPEHVSKRPARDVGCDAARRSLEDRPVRRRARP